MSEILAHAGIAHTVCVATEYGEIVMREQTESTKAMQTAGQPIVNLHCGRMDREQMQKFLLGSEIGTTAWAKVYRRELFDDVSYPVGKYHEDVFTTYKVVDKASRIVATTQVGYLYRKSPNSITTSGFSEKRLDSIQGKKEQLAFVFAHYPSLQKEAETGIVYACNQCLMLMAKAGYKNKAVLDEFQQLYRNYGKSYLNAPVSKKGKALTRVAMLDVKLAYRLFGIVL